MGGRNGRKLPKLDYQHAKHLTMVYDMRLKDKPVLRYAYWSPEKDEYVCHGCKNEALTRSIKANCDDPNWRPPGEFYKEGHILAMNLPPPNGQRATSDDENDENNKTDQNVPQLNQLVIQQDQQSSGSPGQQSPGSPGQQSPGSRGSEQTEQISRSPREEAVSPAAKLLELEAAANREWPSVSSPEASTPRPRKSTLNSGDERVSSVP